MHTGSFVDWLTFLVLSLNARLIWLYLKETNKIRIANEAQLEAQIRPAIAVRFGSLQELVSVPEILTLRIPEILSHPAIAVIKR